MASENKKILVLLDAHAILHRAFHALPSFTSPSGEPTGALYGFVSMFLKIIKELKPDYLAACYDLPEPTFRHQVYEKYKGKRPKMADDLVPQIDNSKKLLQIFGIPIYEKAGFEADDMLASIVWQLRKNKNLKIIIVSGDLDTLQLVQPNVEVYTMKKGIQETILYDEKAVKKRFGFPPKLLPDFKGLMGDPSDNIIGVVGIGEKTAKTLIQNSGSLENLFKNLKKDKAALEKIGIKPRIIKILEENEEEAFFSKVLAQTRKDVPVSFSLNDSGWDFDFEKGKIEEFFREFGFRSLLTRLPRSSNEDKMNEMNEVGLHSLEEEKRVKLAFWMLDSRRVNSKIEDIFAETKNPSLVNTRRILEEEIKKTNFSELFYNTELLLIPILSQMEKKGILLDIGYLKLLSKNYHKKLDNIQEKIWKISKEQFNIGSPKQLAEILFKKMGISAKGVRRTNQGALSTRFSELEKIKNRHPIVQEIFSFRELSKLTSTYIDNLPNFADKDNRLHTNFNQTGTTTGRLSSSEPNLQNIPTRTNFGKAVRRAFIVPAGWKLVSFDYSQIELRVAAALSKDKKLKEFFLKGGDVHAKVASEVFNVPFNKVDSEMRRRAKIINFGIIYGMGVNSLRKNLGCSKEEAEGFYVEYFHDFSGVADYMEKIKGETKEKGYTETLFNRRRYLPEINSSVEFIRKEAERMAINAPIQGTAADIIKMAMVKIGEVLRKRKVSENANLLLQVHDELVFEIKKDIVEDMIPLIKNVMEDEYLPEIPLVVDVSVGSNWAEMRRIKE